MHEENLMSAQIPSLKKTNTAIYLVSCLLRYTIPLIPESPKQSAKTKHLVRGPRLRRSPDPSSATLTAWAKVRVGAEDTLFTRGTIVWVKRGS